MDDPRASDAAALARAAEFDGNLRDGRRRRKRVHGTVDAVVAECAAMPTATDRALVTPVRIPDLVRRGLVLGEALVQLGRWAEARRLGPPGGADPGRAWPDVTRSAPGSTVR